MSFQIMPKTALSEWVEHLGRSNRLIGPRKVRGQYSFKEFQSADDFQLDYPTTILPPKKVLLPQHEDLIEFDNSSNRMQPLLDTRQTVILGVHTCDLHAILMLDQVFNQGLPDQHYQTKRENVTIVSIECLDHCTEHSFCKDMGTPSIPDQFDIHLVDLGNDYALFVGSEKGEALLQGFEHAKECSDDDYRQYNLVMSNKWSRFQYRLKADITQLPSLMTLSKKSTYWEEIENRCLGCGLCSIVCPTCYCFDVCDEVDLALNAGVRYRVWDSCQLNQFAAVAGGHDFRQSRAARQRHRFLRKFKYQSIADGLVGCVGCGRCASTCLAQISPIDVLNKLYSQRVSSTHDRRRANII